MSLTSIKTRFLVSVGANVLRAIISFFTGLLIARGLTPAGYGDLAYLLGTFLAIKALMDMGSSSAFYTFISQQARGRAFYLMYYVWLLIQFVASVLLVVVFLPQSVIDKIWLGSSPEMILLALAASFMQQQVWTTVTQVGESSRQTVKVQLLGVLVIAAHAVVVVILYFGQWLSIAAVLLAIICEYVLAAIVSTRLLSGIPKLTAAPEQGVAEVLGEYWRYCRPLILLAVVSFLYAFADRWLLQRYGGSIQQGFYQISAQFAAVCLLATTSILNIFWREISEANARKDKERVAYLYDRVNRALLMLGAVMSCFMIPWAEELVTFLLGPAYQQSWLIFAVMLFYPIHQSMGQVNGAMFLGCNQTRTYTAISIIGQVVSIPVTYLLLASSADALMPGLALGAMGLAIKMVGMNILLVNIQAWLVARLNGWKYQWKYQLAGIGSVLVLGYLVKSLVCYFIPAATSPMESGSFILALFLSGVFYLAGVAGLLWRYPTIAGTSKSELRILVAKYNPLRS